MFNQTDMKTLASMLCGVDITEVYSPIRVNAVCSKYGLIPGDSFDLRNGYDLSDEKVQAQVIRRISDTESRLIIGSPPCTLFSRLQALNIAVHGPEWEKTFLVEREKAVKHILFCIKIFRLQMAAGAIFLAICFGN